MTRPISSTGQGPGITTASPAALPPDMAASSSQPHHSGGAGAIYSPDLEKQPSTGFPGRSGSFRTRPILSSLLVLESDPARDFVRLHRHPRQRCHGRLPLPVARLRRTGPVAALLGHPRPAATVMPLRRPAGFRRHPLRSRLPQPTLAASALVAGRQSAGQPRGGHGGAGPRPSCHAAGGDRPALAPGSGRYLPAARSSSRR